MQKGAFVFLLFLAAAFKYPSSPWVEYKSADGRYKIEIPREPENSTQLIPTQTGSVEMHLAICNMEKFKDDNIYYSVAYCDYSDTLISSEFRDEYSTKFFRGSVDGAVKNVGGTLLRETEIKYGAFPGREIKIDFQSGKAIITMRSYLVKSRFYILQVITESKRDGNDAAQKFFNSFAITES